MGEFKLKPLAELFQIVGMDKTERTILHAYFNNKLMQGFYIDTPNELIEYYDKLNKK